MSSSLSTVLSLLTSSPTASSASSTQGEEEATTIITNTTTYTPLFDFPLNNSLTGRANEGEDRDYNDDSKDLDDNNTAIPISFTSLLTNLSQQTGGWNKSGPDFYFNNTTSTTGYLNLTFESTTEGTPLLEKVEEYTPIFYFLTALLLCIYVYIYFLNRYEHRKVIAENKKGSSRWGRHPDVRDVVDDDEEVTDDASTKFPVQNSQPQAPSAPEASELGLMSSWRIA